MPVLKTLLACALALAFSTSQASVPFWGDKQSQPVGTPPTGLAEGQWVWEPAAAPSGPIVVVVALDEQRTFVYRNGVLIGYASSSTGKPGYETPTGVFVTLQKDATHRSSTYNNAPMPFQQRLTWGGVALHAGGLPGFPSSHGCVHLPSAFAQVLFDVSPMGMTVVVADEKTAPLSVARPLFLPRALYWGVRKPERTVSPSALWPARRSSTMISSSLSTRRSSRSSILGQTSFWSLVRNCPSVKCVETWVCWFSSVTSMNPEGSR